jgi:hypothetical protein
MNHGCDPKNDGALTIKNRGDVTRGNAYERRRWPQASSLDEKETDERPTSNIERPTSNKVFCQLKKDSVCLLSRSCYEAR